MKTLQQQQQQAITLIGFEAEVIFAQDHNILGILLVPILSLEAG
jgi:hypothetical protein